MGGLAGHMSHLYDNPRLTFGQIKRIMQDAAEGSLEGTEKTDGQNLYISFSVSKQELEFVEGGAKAARNKTNIKSGGMNANQLASKFSFNKSLQKSFKQALKDFESVIKQMPRAKQEEIFGHDTNIYYNAEVINPETANVINYDSKLVSIHRGGGAEFDKETGSAVEVEIIDPETGEVITGQKDVSRHANTLADELDKIQQDLADNKFKIEMDAVFKLKALENEEALNKAISEIEDEISAEGISDSQMVIEYVMARILSIIREKYSDLYGDEEEEEEEESEEEEDEDEEEEDEEEEKKIGRSLEETEKLLLKRIIFSNPSYRSAYGQDGMPKELKPNTIIKGASLEDRNLATYIVNNSNEILKDAIEPIENTIHDFTVEMLKGLESLFVLDNKKETERLRKEVSKAIKAIEQSGNEDALEILQKQMNKLKNIENISTAAEGFVFDHDGWSYKFTGNFAPINQILGLFKYGRKGIPPLDQLNEQKEEEAKRKIFVWPGRFQPMGKHHYEVFKALQEEHGSENVYIATSDAKTSKKSPLNFEEKKKVMIRHGVPEDKILKVDRMYRTEDLEEFFSADDDVLTFIVGKKDQGRLSSDYYSSYEDNKTNLETFDNKVYLKIAPHICITLKNGEEMCGSSIRSAMSNLTPESFKHAMGWFEKDIYEMLKSKINETVTSLSETILSIIEEVINEKYEKKSCTKKGDKKDEKGSCVVTTSRGESCYDNCQQAYTAVELEELKVDVGRGGTTSGPKKCPKCDLGQKNQPCLCGNYMEPHQHQDDGTDDLEFDEIEEISGAGGGGYSLPLGMKPRYFNSPMPKVKGINIYNGKKKK